MGIDVMECIWPVCWWGRCIVWELIPLSVSGQCVGGGMYCVGIDAIECIWPVCWWR